MRPRLRSLSLAAALAALALAPGCDTAPARIPKGTQTVVLSPDQPAPSVTMELISAVRVVLPGPEAGSGLVWEIASNNTRVLEQMGPLRAAQGTTATTTVSFYALKPGRSVIRFFLVHPDAAEAVPAASCTLTVHVEE
jgi:hypothetical protein